MKTWRRGSGQIINPGGLAVLAHSLCVLGR